MSERKQIAEHNRYQVIPRTLIFMFDDQDRVLLIKGAPEKKLWSGLLNGIGGHLEAGEDILESACRELEEETGLTGIPLQFCGQIMIDIENELGIALFLFSGFYTGDDFSPSSEGRLCWSSVDSIDEEKVVADLPILLPKVFDFKLGESLIIGRYQYDSDGNLIIILQ